MELKAKVGGGQTQEVGGSWQQSRKAEGRGVRCGERGTAPRVVLVEKEMH